MSIIAKPPIANPPTALPPTARTVNAGIFELFDNGVLQANGVLQNTTILGQP